MVAPLFSAIEENSDSIYTVLSQPFRILILTGFEEAFTVISIILRQVSGPSSTHTHRRFLLF
jgi:hypothetical protein